MPNSIIEKLVVDLQAVIDAVCPNKGVYIGLLSNKNTWGFHPSEEATQQQISDGNAVIANFDAAAYQPPNGSIYKLEDCYEKRRAEYPAIGDQLDSLMKALEALSYEFVLPEQTLDWINACREVKDKYPKT